ERGGPLSEGAAYGLSRHGTALLCPEDRESDDRSCPPASVDPGPTPLRDCRTGFRTLPSGTRELAFVFGCAGARLSCESSGRPVRRTTAAPAPPGEGNRDLLGRRGQSRQRRHHRCGQTGPPGISSLGRAAAPPAAETVRISSSRGGIMK